MFSPPGGLLELLLAISGDHQEQFELLAKDPATPLMGQDAELTGYLEQ